MQDKEGGTYTPDTREDEDSIGAPRPRGGDRAEKTPLTLIISGIFLVLLLLLVVIFYNSKLSSANRLPAELGSEVGSYKDAKVIEAKPIKEDDLLDTLGGSSDSASTKLVPASEAPTSVTPSPASASSSAAPVANGTSSPEVTAALTPKAAPQPLPPVKTEPAPALKPATQTQPPVQAAKPPAPKPLPPVAVAKPAPAPVKPAPAPTPVAAATPKPAAGSYAVQIGAFGSPEIANSQFASAVSQFGNGGASKSVEKVDVKGQTYYRTAFAGFATKDKAAAFCAKIKAAGKTCFVK